MAWFVHNWFWLLLAVILVGFSVIVTRHIETRRYRLRLVVSLLLMEYWVLLVTRTTSLTALLPLGIVGFVLIRLCVPALSHILAQGMADKATDAMFGEREPAPPVMDRPAVTRWRKQGRSDEAVMHLKTVLEKSPHDFESRFLLAEIYVEDMRDFPAAEQEIQTIQKSAVVSPALQALAGQRLSTWREIFDRGARELEALRSPGTVRPVVIEVPVEEPISPPVPVTPVLETVIVASHGAVNELCEAGQYGSAMDMIDRILVEKPDDLASWAIKARIYAQYLGQPSQADKALRRITDAEDIKPDQVEAIERLADVFARDKDEIVKAGRLWRKLGEAPSVPREQKVVMLGRLRQWQASASN